jgi:hypothetical protein
MYIRWVPIHTNRCTFPHLCGKGLFGLFFLIFNRQKPTFAADLPNCVTFRLDVSKEEKKERPQAGAWS